LRTPTEKEYCHDRLGKRFEEAVSDYDTGRRLEVLIDRFLPAERLAGRRVLEVGAGLGFFSARLQERGGVVTASDIGPELLRRVRERVGCECVIADALSLVEHFGPGQFDVVLSSECIEHTPDPMEAVRQMAGVLKPGGYLSLSTPNRVWWPVVRAASVLKLRPYDGHENFSSFSLIRRILEASGVDVVEERGLHLFPFQLRLHDVSRWCDEQLQSCRGLMINLCVLGRKRG
jgi:2-polyprenyl-6-hydroxyphenyl methylase/3-demethylubiquinone-9 3-methyltransferase